MRHRNVKGAKRKSQITQIFSVFSVNFCVFCGFSPIGVNLCQSVDKHAKAAKDTEDAKKKFFCALCKFLCFLWFSIGVNLCQSVDENHRLHRLAQIFSAKSAESVVSDNQSV